MNKDYHLAQARKQYITKKKQTKKSKLDVRLRSSKWRRVSKAERVRIAQLMAAPIRRNLDYAGVARRSTRVTQLDNDLDRGVLPKYNDQIDNVNYQLHWFKRTFKDFSIKLDKQIKFYTKKDK